MLACVYCKVEADQPCHVAGTGHSGRLKKKFKWTVQLSVSGVADNPARGSVFVTAPRVDSTKISQKLSARRAAECQPVRWTEMGSGRELLFCRARGRDVGPHPL